MADVARGPGLGRFLLIILLFIAIAITGVWYYNKTHAVTVGDHVGEAIDSMPQGVGKAADEATDPENVEKVEAALDKTGKAASSAVSETSDELKSAVKKTDHK